MGINHITLVGEVVRKPELRFTPNGIPTANFQISVKRPPRQEGQTYDVSDTFKVVTWRKLAETIGETLSKGDLVSVEGRIHTRSIETPEGQRKKLVEVDALSVEAIRTGTPSASEPDEPEYEEAEPAFGDADEIPF
jgi:single-strand DNA-binding protein